jgi:4-phospho-D-threonate 3-dehydrogenase / 4-phospho-D-erythronate 3-dehydrogenase
VPEKPLIAAVIGEPAGVGPEICVKALDTGEPQARARIIAVGSAHALGAAAVICGSTLRFRAIDDLAAATFDDGTIAVLDDGALPPGAHAFGTASAAGGRASFGWIQRALDLAERGQIDGCVIAPIDRTSWNLAGIVGATEEMLPPDTWLLRVTGRLRTVPIAEHVPMREVPDTVKRELVLRVIRLIAEKLERWGFVAPTIGVAGLNPHCVGPEDRDEIAPAVADARAAGLDVTGPVSPDAIFRQALDGRYDAVVTMYHDQGQIAVKTVGLNDACTIFVGLPYVRVGVPHGSALDVAGTGKAQHFTMLSALRTAGSLAAGRGL